MSEYLPETNFAPAIHYNIIVGQVLLSDIVELVDTVDAFLQNAAADVFDVGIFAAFAQRGELVEDVLCKAVQVDGAVDLDDVRALVGIEQFQGVCYVADVDILLHHVLDTEVLLPHLDDPAVHSAVVREQAVCPDLFQSQKRVDILFRVLCVRRISLFGEQEFYILKDASIENAVRRGHEHNDRYKPHDNCNRPVPRRDRDEDERKHKQRDHNVCHGIALPYRILHFDFFRDNSH